MVHSCEISVFLMGAQFSFDRVFRRTFSSHSFDYYYYYNLVAARPVAVLTSHRLLLREPRGSR